MLLLGSCTAGPESPSVPRYTAPVALFVSPDSARIERMRAESGEEFAVAADDAMWYRAEAMALLDSLGIAHEAVEHGPIRFRVHGEEREYLWGEMAGAWYVVLYDGSREPQAFYPVDIREKLALFAR